MKFLPKFTLLCLLLTFTASCAHFHRGGDSNTPPSNHAQIVGIDPTISWSPATTACNGSTLTGVTYNVYIQPSTGSIPTTSSTVTGCTGTFNFVDLTKITKTNATAVSGITYNAALGIGSYIVIVEAVASGVQGIASAQSTFQVQNVPNSVTGVQVSWNRKELEAPKNLSVR